MGILSRVRKHSSAFPSTALAVPLFEDWLERSEFPDAGLRDRVKLAGEEILDNLIRHSRLSPDSKIRVLLRVLGRDVTLSFFFRSSAFREFAWSGGAPRAVYDSKERRWRGLGLFMIDSLAENVRYRAGVIKDRIDASF